jgi:hypothetical protein
MSLGLKKKPLGYILYMRNCRLYTSVNNEPVLQTSRFPSEKNISCWASDTWRSTLKNCWVSSHFFNFHMCILPQSAWMAFFSLYPCNLGWNRSMAIVFDLKEEKRMAWKEIFFTCVDRWAKVFSFQSKSQQPNTVRDSDTIRFPNFICKKYGTLLQVCNQFGMYYIHQWLLRW